MAILRTLVNGTKADADDCNFNFTALNNESATISSNLSSLSASTTQEIADLNANKVSKSGDTMTGTLKIQKIGTSGANGCLTAEVPRDNYADIVTSTDGENFKRCCTIRMQNSDTAHTLTLAAHDFNDSTPAGIVISKTSDGTLTTTASTPSSSSNSTDIATTAWVRSFINNDKDVILKWLRAKTSDPINVSDGWTATTNGWLLIHGGCGEGTYCSWKIGSQVVFMVDQRNGGDRAGALAITSVAFIGEGQKITKQGTGGSSVVFVPCAL